MKEMVFDMKEMVFWWKKWFCGSPFIDYGSLWGGGGTLCIWPNFLIFQNILFPQDQYKFCYDAMLTLVESFTTYDNIPKVQKE
jgi:hypothetical protein